MSELKGLESEPQSTQLRYQLGQLLEWIEGAHDHTEGLKEQIEFSKYDDDPLDRHLDGGVTTLFLALTLIVEKAQAAYQLARVAEKSAVVPTEEKRHLHFIDEIPFWEGVLFQLIGVETRIKDAIDKTEGIAFRMEDEKLKKELESQLAKFATALDQAKSAHSKIRERTEAIREALGKPKKPKASRKKGATQ
jgi:hypothetical protein